MLGVVSDVLNTGSSHSIQALLQRAIRARVDFFDDAHESAFRLFNGFLEGWPDLVVDLYARTLVLHDYAEDPVAAGPSIQSALAFLLHDLPWVQAAVLKQRTASERTASERTASERTASDEEARRGRLVFGQSAARKVRENGVWYALDLTLNLDASLYLDTRGLRAWALSHLRGSRVLNTFAYTGSLGVAAAAGGARQVIHLDLNRRFLNVAKDSYTLNGLPVRRADFLAGDFWMQINQLKRQEALFDCIFVDPPFFSTTARGTVDLVSESRRVVNKVRPLVAHNGWLVVVNNALFLSGADFLEMLRELCSDNYLSIEDMIPVPADFTGFEETRIGALPVDPAPFNHSTKIAILRVLRKDLRAAH